MSSLSERLKKLRLLVGDTPLRCTRILGVELCFKVEYANPTGSHKDRIAVNMLAAAVEEGLLRSGDCVAEISSGNTAAAVAWAAGFLGLRPLLFVEKKASEIKKLMIESMGGSVVEIGDELLTRDDAAREAERRGCLLLDQMRNEYNHLAHYQYTGYEIIRQTSGNIDYFVMGIGTAGTITGVGRRLKEDLGSPVVIGVVPRGSPLDPERGAREPEAIEGLVSSAAPPLLERHRRYVDRIVAIGAAEAYRGISLLLREAGLPVGPSTGAVTAAVARLVEEGVIERGARVVTLAADSLTRYPEAMRMLGPRG